MASVLCSADPKCVRGLEDQGRKEVSRNDDVAQRSPTDGETAAVKAVVGAWSMYCSAVDEKFCAGFKPFFKDARPGIEVTRNPETIEAALAMGREIVQERWA